MCAVHIRAQEILHAILRHHGREDFAVRTENGGRVVVRYGSDMQSVLVPAWAGEGFPKDVGQAIRDMTRDLHPGETPVVVARRLSPGARRDLDVLSLSWADEAGHARITAEPGLHVLLDRQHPVVGDVAPLPVRWSGTTGAVAEAILTRAVDQRLTSEERRTLIPVTTLAQGLGVSAGLVSRTLLTFDAEGWTVKSGPRRGARARRHLAQPGSLLSAWAGWFRTTTPTTALAHGLIGDADELLNRLDDAWAGHWWALTGLTLLDRRAPFVTGMSTVDVYLDPEAFADPTTLHRLLEGASLRLVDSGPRVRVLQADAQLARLVQKGPDPGEVGDIRLYGDLLRSGVRGEDAAEHLRETRIGF